MLMRILYVVGLNTSQDNAHYRPRRGNEFAEGMVSYHDNVRICVIEKKAPVIPFLLQETRGPAHFISSL